MRESGMFSFEMKYMQIVNGDTLGYSQASVSIVVKEVSGLLAKCGKKWIRFPKAPNLQDTKEQFYLIGEFPGVIGAIDCHLIGDSGYPRSKCLYTPKLNPSIAVENKYNKSHIKTRNVIERVNEVLKS
ncbi:hypothetical protein QTP88_019719 [Uroleucon formosanum]